ncbi:BA14K family protein [Mesorhizobium sp. LCM 4577]|uniref:BA14K family protein n=1 Tax=Mesorhizobium sp. LCM 4577 TaxID=1848288 RepID=UPI0009E5F537
MLARSTIISGLVACLLLAQPAGSAVAAPPVVSSAPVPSYVTQARYHHGHRFILRRNHAYWHGHRGYRHYRPGYRRYNGWWFPPAAFALGAIIGGALSQHGPVSSRHVRWCYDHYRSYRASDNTFQPYHGPRRQCRSPYE